MNAEGVGKNNRFSLWLACAFFLYIVYLPVTQNLFKGCLIAAILLLILAKYLLYGKALRIDSTVLSWVLFYAAVGICYILFGLIMGAPGALFSSFVYLVYPVVYAIFIAAATQARIWVPLLKVMPIAAIAIGVGTLEYVLWSAGWFPISLYVDPGLVESITFYQGYVQMSHYSLSSLIFLVPFLMAALVVYSEGNPPFIARKLMWAGLLLGIAVTILGGRRALLLLVVGTPLLIWLFRSQLPTQIRGASRRRILVALLGSATVVLVGALLLFGTLDVGWHGLAELLAGGFDFDFDPNALTRTEQFFPLLRGWEAHPIFGNGLGAYTPEVVRNNRLWEYELQYILLLFTTGVVGVLLYSSGIVWVYWKAIKIIRSGSVIGIHMVPVLVGTTCILVANSVDPYLQTFGHLWMVFLPIGLINWHRISEGSDIKSAVFLASLVAHSPHE